MHQPLNYYNSYNPYKNIHKYPNTINNIFFTAFNEF